jgi:hypothetical protein
MMRAQIAAVALGVLLCGCVQSAGEPSKPAGVPPAAVWVGGADGGVFVLVEPKPAARDAVMARIYADGTGAVLFAGELVLDAPGAPLPDLRDAKSFGGWDGDTLFLADGRALRAPPASPR